MEKITNRLDIEGAVESLIGGREENQDDFGFAETQLGLLVVVCDGMGGGPAGRTASSLACETIIRQLSAAKMTDNPESVLYIAVVAANNALLGAIAAKPELQGMGTTCVCLLVNRKNAYIAHVGDSRCYQLRRGQIVFRTADHSYVSELVRRKTITEEEARQSKYSNVITRAIGVGQELEPEIDKVTVRPGDRFALMSDGIWGSMPENRLVENLSLRGDMETIVPTIAHAVDQIGVNEGGEHDNLTLALVEIADVQKRQPVRTQQSQPSAPTQTSPLPPDLTVPPVHNEKTKQQSTDDSDLHITITELTDEGMTRRKNMWIWILSFLLIAAIAVISWILIRNGKDDSVDDSKYATIDNRTQSKADNDENRWRERYVQDVVEIESKKADHQSKKNNQSSIITDKEKEIEKQGNESKEKEETKQKSNLNLTEKQSIIHNCGSDLKALMDKYRDATAIPKTGNSDKWKARQDSIKRSLVDISANAKKAMRIGNSGVNSDLRKQITEIENLSKSDNLLDKKYGRPSGETEKSIAKVIGELEKLTSR